ncbi:MAG: hypothetical protein E6G34_12690 [Actinobacteria bacterium]|nr:MAG: hypothetical protein E6G34_12690 [Actinomycetota bacterium]
MAMTDEQRAGVRDLLQLVSRTIETNPGATAPAIRARARVKRKEGDMAIGLLLRGGFIEQHALNAEETYRSVKPYRVSNEAPRAAFGETHAAGQGGG